MSNKVTVGLGTAILGLAAAILIVLPINAVILAWTAHKIWSWMIASQYGAGPSLKVWFGATSIFSLLMARQNLKKADTNVANGVISSCLVCALSCLFSLGAVWLVGHVVGWM